MGKTTIEWASHSWNPYSWNCDKVSPGCAHCYAEALARRWGQQFSGAPTTRGQSAWNELRSLPPGAVVFVNSMSDTYHEGASWQMIHSIHNAAAYSRPDVTFLVLTKRPERALGLSPLLAWPPNLWLGASVERNDYLWRLDYLLHTPAAGHFVSAEPLLGRLDLIQPYLYPQYRIGRGGAIKRPALGWVIAGGESGAGRREFFKGWAAELQIQATAARIPFLFKQGSAYTPGQDRLLGGREWNESPFYLEKHDPAVECAKPVTPVQLEMF